MQPIPLSYPGSTNIQPEFNRSTSANTIQKYVQIFRCVNFGQPCTVIKDELGYAKSLVIYLLKFCLNHRMKCLLGILISFNFVFAGDDILSNLKKSHPLLLIDANTWQSLKDNRKTDPILDKILIRIDTDSKTILNKPLLTYEKKGKRLLSVSREAVKRILNLVMAYKTSQDLEWTTKFKDRAEQELLNVADFADWNPSHFLDVAEMTTAVALGYDWLYDDLSSSSRKKLRHAILEKAIKHGDDPSLPNTSWYKKEHNWNQVCFGGLALGALAIANDYPTEAGKMLTQVRTYITYGLKAYAPDGVWPEGPGYWAYGTSYQVLLNESLRTALGTNWNLWDSPGFKTTGDFLLHATGPTLKYFNYSDGDDDPDVEPAVYKISAEYNRPELLYFQNQILSKVLAEPENWVGRFFPLLAIWSKEFNVQAEPTTPKNWNGNGPQPLAIFRSSWKQDALYLAVKGGSPNLNHAHMDAGTFVLDRDGIRWAVDLGAQDYLSLESKNIDIWSRSQKSDRWNVFRMNTSSHNTLTIGPSPQQLIDGSAKITKFKSQGKTQSTEIDLSSLFKDRASKVIRRFEIKNQKNIEITDTIEGTQKDENIHWNLTTKATAVVKNKIVILKDQNKELKLKLVEPKDAHWKIKQADPQNDYDAPNPNVSLITIDYKTKEMKKTKIKVIAY